MHQTRTLLALALLLSVALATGAPSVAHATDYRAMPVTAENAAPFPLDPKSEADEPASEGLALAFVTTLAGIAFVSTVFARNRRTR